MLIVEPLASVNHLYVHSFAKCTLKEGSGTLGTGTETTCSNRGKSGFIGP